MPHQPTPNHSANDNGGHILALDIGDRRIGVAIASTVARLPRPLETIDRQKTEPLAHLKRLVAEHSVVTLVAGRPRDMNGNETAQTRSAVAFAEEVSKALGMPVELMDEAGTSLAAKEELQSSGEVFDKADIDMQAACLILDDWLIGQELEA